MFSLDIGKKLNTSVPTSNLYSRRHLHSLDTQVTVGHLCMLSASAKHSWVMSMLLAGTWIKGTSSVMTGNKILFPNKCI